MSLTRVRLHEVSELEPRVIELLGSIEEGLTVLDNQLGIGDPGRPDILAIDSSGTLVIVELKSDSADVAALDQAVRYFEWASMNLALLAKPFPRIRHDRPPRLFIIAPTFDDGIQRLVRYLEIEVNLTIATCVRDTSANYTGILFEPLDIPRSSPNPLLRSEQDVVSYMADDTVRDEFGRVLKAIREDGLSIEPYQGGKDLWLKVTLGVEELAYLQTRRKYFNWQCRDANGHFPWPPVKFDNYDDWARMARLGLVSFLSAEKGKA